MTSPLRRKRRITAPSTRAKKNSLSILLAPRCDAWGERTGRTIAAAVVGLAAVFGTAALAGAEDSGVRQTSYSTPGQSGRALKWVAPQVEAGGVVQASAVENVRSDAAAKRLRVAQQPRTGELTNNPFGDQKPNGAKPEGLQPLPSSAKGKPTTKTPLPKIELEPAQAAGDRSSRDWTDELAVGVMPRSEPCNTAPIGPINKDILDQTKPKAGQLPQSCPMSSNPFVPRSWQPTTFHWTASALCHKPAYFEDVHLERYGHTWGPIVQPFVSTGHFFLSIPAMPYAMALYPPNECIYTLGYYRPGSCTPYYLDPLPTSVRAIVAEGGVVAGLVLLIP